jgi:malonate transporter
LPRRSSFAGLLSALPTGALVFAVAWQYDPHVNRASAAIVLSTAVSVVTVSGRLILLEIG